LCVGLFWEEILFLGKAYFWERDLFWVKTYFWKERPNFGVRAIGGKKETCRKRRKISMQKEKQHGAQEDKTTM
jgi:hypothetical protein